MVFFEGEGFWLVSFSKNWPFVFWWNFYAEVYRIVCLNKILAIRKFFFRFVSLFLLGKGRVRKYLWLDRPRITYSRPLWRGGKACYLREKSEAIYVNIKIERKNSLEGGCGRSVCGIGG